MSRRTCLLLIILMLITCNSYAEIKTFTHTVKQEFVGSQSPDDARIGAITKAKREVLEKAGTYLQSMTIVRESVVEKDEIISLAAGVLNAEIMAQKNFATENTFGIIVTAKVDVDTSILEERVRKLLKDGSLLEKYNESQKREEELLAKIKELERENKDLKTLPLNEQKQKEEVLKNQFREATQGLSASELRKKTIAFWQNGRYTDPDKAIEYLNEAIILDPKYARAYMNRGSAWNGKGDYDRAISDFNKAIELDPKLAHAYNNRGTTWYKKGNRDQAILDYTKAIELNPTYGNAYYNRGRCWYYKGDYVQAISDFNKAIELDPKLAFAYNNRGVAWQNKGDHDRAISDFNKAIELDPKFAFAYKNRAISYDKLGQSSKAADDFNNYLKIDGDKNGDADQVRQVVRELGYIPKY
ncbi:MAG: tetratricopeptide repeat protein [Thermodesulfobacteriota bacterium]